MHVQSGCLIAIRDLKDPATRRQGERRLKSEFAFLQSLLWLFLPTYFVTVTIVSDYIKAQKEK